MKEEGWVGTTNGTEPCCVLAGSVGRLGRWRCLRSSFMGFGRDLINELGFCPVSAGEQQRVSIKDPGGPRKTRKAGSTNCSPSGKCDMWCPPPRTRLK